MEYVELNTKQKMPALGIGTWKSKKGEVGKAVKIALETGYRHIDCAYAYENEDEIGEILKETFDQGKIKREDIWITSKLWNIFHDPKDVQPICEKTIKDLQCGYLDLYLMHCPVCFEKRENLELFPRKDENTMSTVNIPLIETWHAMEKLVELGLVKSIGISNFTKEKIEEIYEKAKIKPVINQVENHPYLQQEELCQYCRKNGIQITAYSPLGTSDSKKEEDPSLLQDPVINEIAKKHNVSSAQILIKWQIQRGNTVIPKAVKPEHIKDNFDCQNIKLTEEDMKQIATLDRHFRFLNPLNFWNIDMYGEANKK
ncbi:aldo/keto reductase [Anaeramoeba ignava]|uniref:Aldo/keto reductase n=1 Tax=Anaeramoeba ignava TaxID=1746090 RepID=A0A9Q0RF48_ANAIG|nr:aldo/keto reductase [Anaeramoeba ignava]